MGTIPASSSSATLENTDTETEETTNEEGTPGDSGTATTGDSTDESSTEDSTEDSTEGGSTEEPEAEDEDETDNDELGGSGRKALDAERKARKTAEKKARDAERKAVEAEQKLWFAEALVAHPVPEEYRHLVKGDTAEDLKKAAESVAALTASKPGVVRASGTNGDTSTVGTSVKSGRSLYRDQHTSKTKRKDSSDA